jgi:ribonuclease H / adenosylcobalamin/alpha-ribazole phosphatase
MRTVLLVRHGTHAEVGRVLSGRSEIALDDGGRRQAEALAAELAGVSLASLHSSPRRRTQETIAPLAERRGHPVQTAPALDEIDFGGFTGRSFASLDGDVAWDQWNAERATARCPGGETMAEAVERASTYVRGLDVAAYPALCVTHCDIIRGLIVRALGLSLDRMFDFDCEPASVTTLEIDGDRTRVVALNERLRR